MKEEECFLTSFYKMTYWLSSYREQKKTKTKWKIEGSLILICIKLNLFVWLMDEKIIFFFDHFG